MASTPHIAIDLSRRRLCAVHATWSRGKLEVQKTLSERLPLDLDSDDASALGAWVGRRLHQAGLPLDKAMLALPRDAVALKRLTLPTNNEVELPDMARLAMQRELPFDPEAAVIDFLPLTQQDSSWTVIAIAVPRDVLIHSQTMARAAGLQLEHVSLRSMGGAALMEAMSDPQEHDERCVLLVDILGPNLDFTILEQGAIRFSRAGVITKSESDSDPDAAILREIRRTWMSFRIVNENSHVDEALLMGDENISNRSIASVGEMLQVKTRVLEQHDGVTVNGASMQGLWTLAGLLLASHRESSSIDFLHPRKAPDVGAKKRQLSLAMVGVLLVVLFGGWTLARRTLAPLEGRLASLQSDSRMLAPQYRRYGRDLYKLEHLNGWESSRIDWLEHASTLQALSPIPGQVVLDEWRGSLGFRGVQFDRRANAWSAPKEIVIVLEGEAADRKTADAFRASLVQTSLYTASSGGTDTEGGKRLPYGFTYRLTSEAATPPERVSSTSSTQEPVK